MYRLVARAFCNKRLSPLYKIRCIHREEDFIFDNKVLSVFDKDFFNCWDGLYKKKTLKSYCSHVNVGSWLPAQNPSKWYDLKVKIAEITPRWLTTAFKQMKYWIKRNTCFL